MTIHLDGHDVVTDDDELAVLRLRAYGPGADITDDPAALARLQALEAGARAAQQQNEPHGVTELLDPVDDADAQSAMAPEAQAEEPDAPPAAERDVQRVPPARLPPGWRRWIAAGLVTTVLAVAAGVTIGVTGTPRPDAVLHAGVMDAESAGQARDLFTTVTVYGIEISQMQPYGSFRGLTAWAGQSDAGTRCLFLINQAEDLWSRGCAPAGLDAIADFTKPDGSLSPLFGDLPAGSTIRFILHRDTIEVWIAPARYLSALATGHDGAGRGDRHGPLGRTTR